MSNSTEPAPEAFPEPPLFRGRLIEMVSPPQVWALEAFPGHLALYAPGESQPLIYPRVELSKKVELFRRPALLVLTHPRKVMLRFDSPADLARVREWMGPPTDEQLALVLKRRYAWVFPVAALFIVTSLPYGGDPKDDLKPAPFQPWGFGLGVSLALMGLMAKFKPHRILFLLDSLWFALLAGGQVWRILKGDSLWWILLVLFEIWLVLSGIELYRHFARTRKA